jgi:hypothetical protein
LYEHDILKPLPKSHHEYYDVIAVRALVTVLADDEWEKAVANVVQCLSRSPSQLVAVSLMKGFSAEPGGYLQWVDPDFSNSGWKVTCLKPGATTAALQKGIDTVRRWATSLAEAWILAKGSRVIFVLRGSRI